MTSWHRSEYAPTPAAKTRRYVLVIAMTIAFGGGTLAAALPDPAAPSDSLLSAQSSGSASGGAMRNIIEEHARARAAASVIDKPLTIGAAKCAADPVTTGSVGRNGGSSLTGRKVRVARADDAIAHWLRRNGVVN